MPLTTPPERTPWSNDEVHWVVADYLAMLTLELTGQPYNKTARRNALLPKLNGRTASSIEFKHGNITVVMLQMGFPPLRGYQPRSNFQKALVEAVTLQVQKLPLLDEAAEAAVQRPAALYEAFNFKDVQTSPPKHEHQVGVEEEVRHYLAGPIRRDYLEREARNRSLGLSGELLALQFEQWRLKELGAPDLAGKVEHVAATRGDGLGYDILSFDADGSERYVEVKTTAFSQTTPFFVSANEACFARDHASRFKLYRFCEFRARPRMFQLAGAIEQHCRLDPSTFRAQFQ